MKKIFISTLLCVVFFSAYSQYNPDESDCFIDDVVMSEEYEEEMSMMSLTPNSSYGFYNNLRTWIPYMHLSSDDEPLKKSPIKVIEISFHVFLDDNGGNNIYTDNAAGRNRLMTIFNYVNQIYSGYPDGPSDPVAGVVELPGYDTRIRFTLGNNNERIYFYRNTALNHHEMNSVPSLYNYVNSNYPGRADKLNVYFIAAHRNGRVKQDSVIITNQGSGYTSVPTVTFSKGGVKGSAVVENGKVTKIMVETEGSIYGFAPPTITISGGGGSGAAAYVTGLAGGATGYANFPSETLTTNHYTVMLQSDHNLNDWISGTVLAHEFGHNLGLNHTYAYANTCNCEREEYLSDVFGNCLTNTCPHIQQWVDPFDNTIPNSEKHTNNLMGGSARETYISPMQAGQMHRSLALKSSRKYVRKETYSSVPLVITENEVWDFNLKLYRDIEISQGAVLTLANMFELPYGGTITINNGADLIIEGTVKLSGGNEIVLKSGGSLRFASASLIEIDEDGFIEVRAGGYFCIQPGAVVKLNDVESSIVLKPGCISGSDPVLFDPTDCAYPVWDYPVTGLGKIIRDYPANDVYLQNEVIREDRYYVGRNIFIGNNVTSQKPQGNVVIENNAYVVFDALEEVVIDAGFECVSGAGFEVKK